jgi:outer membrane protein TolC
MLITPVKKKLPLVILFTALVGASIWVKAADTNQTKLLSLDSAITLGLAHSHQVELSANQLAEAHSTSEDIKNRIIPSVNLSVGYTRLSNIPVEYFSIPGYPGEIPSTALFPIILNSYAATAALNESIFNGFLLKYAALNMEYNEKGAEYNLESKKKDVTLTVITTYLNLFKLQKAHELVLESLQQLAAHVKEIGDFASHGLATQNDLLRAQLNQSNGELDEINIKNQMLSVNYNMDILLGLAENTIVSIDSNSISGTKAIQPLSYYIQKAGENREDIKALDMQQKAAEAGIKETQSNLYPKLIISADYDYLRPNPRIVPPLDQFQPTWDLGVRITYSLTDLYANKNKTDISKARYAEAQANFSVLTDNAKMEINQSYLDYQQSLEKIQVAEKSLGQAQENYKLTKSRYDNHVALVTDLMDANNYLLNAQINLISSKADAQLSYYKLLKSAGELNYKK